MSIWGTPLRAIQPWWRLGAAAILIAVAHGGVAAPPELQGVGTRWTPTLVENFDGPTLNGSIWSINHQDGRPNGNNGVTWGWDAGNVSLANGKLVIRTKADGDGTFSSGGIWTKDKWSQTYGHYEARIMLPPANSGHQAAFWMTAQDGGHLTAGNDGRDGAEIDIVETPDATDQYRVNLHWDGYDAFHQSSGATIAAAGIHAGYHDFGLFWDATTLDSYYDGRRVRTYTGVGVPRVPEVLRASVGILDWCDGDIRTAALPQETRFDHVRAWRLMPQAELTVVDSDSSALAATGKDWQRKTGTGDYGGAMLQSGSAGDALTLTFGGTAVDVFVRKGQYGGLVNVHLDGTLVGSGLDTYSSSQVFQHRLYSADGLSAEPHTLRVEVTGKAVTAAVSSLLMFDALQYVPLPPSALTTISVASGTTTQATAGYPALSGSTPVLKTGAGTVVFDRANGLAGSVTVAAGELRMTHAAALATARLVPVDGGRVTLAPSLRATVGGLTVDRGGIIDVGSGAVTFAGLSTADAAAALAAGRGNGTWNGTSGIVSSRAGGGRTVGWLADGQGATFAFAAPGDTNLDWTIDIIDLANVLAGGRFDTGRGASWFEGDFNYDTMVDILDAADLLGGGLFDTGPYVLPVAAAVAVPEPNPAAWLLPAVLGSAALLGRK
ncbi:MAG: family 16 glycosylhydrolase [Planctomycetaceae bacterium]